MLKFPNMPEIEKFCGIIGYPVKHSISPNMHNAAFEELKLIYHYLLFEVAPNHLKEAITDLKNKKILGFNVTIPHKEHAIPLLDEIDPLAKKIGAVNTVKNENGKLKGYNTDAQGFIESLKQDLKIDPKGKRVIIFGAGGAAKAVGASLAESGVSFIAFTEIVFPKAEQLAQNIKNNFGTQTKAYLPAVTDLQKELKTADIIINATPMGMHPKENESPLEENFELPKGIIVYDLVYNPPLTKFLQKGARFGAKTSNGLNMLIRQAAAAFEIWTGKKAPLEVMKKAAEKALYK